MVKGQWLQRPYTLTDWDDSGLEITVKLEDRDSFLTGCGRPHPVIWSRSERLKGMPTVTKAKPGRWSSLSPGSASPLRWRRCASWLARAPSTCATFSAIRAEADRLAQLQSLAQASDFSLATFATGASDEAGGQRPSVEALIKGIDAMGPAQVVVCGPGGNTRWERRWRPSNIEVFVEDFQETIGRGVNTGCRQPRDGPRDPAPEALSRIVRGRACLPARRPAPWPKKLKTSCVNSTAANVPTMIPPNASAQPWKPSVRRKLA